MIAFLLMFYFENTTQNIVYALEFIEKEDCESKASVVNNEETEFEKAYDNNEYVKRKVDEEVENITGIIDEKIEEKLNEGGMFDDEIKKIDSETLVELEQADVEQLDILTEYYLYNNDMDLELVKMNNEEIDQVFGEEYYDSSFDEVEYEAKKDDSLLLEIGRTIGLVPEKAYAATAYEYGNEKKVSGAILKKTMIVVPITDKKFKIYVECEWKNTKYLFPREVDLLKITWDVNKMLYDDTSVCRTGTNAKVETVYTVTTRKQLTGQLLSSQTYTKTDNIHFLPYARTFDTQVDIYKNQGALSGTAMIIAVDLMDDSTIPDELNNTVTKTEVESIILRAQTYLIKQDVYGGEQPPTDESFSYSVIYSHLSRKLAFDFKYVTIRLTGTKEQIICDIVKCIAVNASRIEYKTYYKDIETLRGTYFYQYKYK